MKEPVLHRGSMGLPRASAAILNPVMASFPAELSFPFKTASLFQMSHVKGPQGVALTLESLQSSRL